MEWERARTPDKINQRKTAIVKAAMSLFRKNGYDKVSLNAIAAEAGFTKSNVYRYFSSREEIFLSIYCDLVHEWSDSITQTFRKLRPELTSSDFAKAWVATTLEHKPLLNLAPMLFTSMEQNSAFEQLISFKSQMTTLLSNQALELKRLFPALSEQDVHRFLMFAHACMSTLWAACSYNKVMAKVYRTEAFCHLKPDFQIELESAIEILITGIRNRGKTHGNKK